MAKMKKAYILVEVELADNLEELYPNYRFNFFKRKDFISMIKNEIKNLVTPQFGAKIKATNFKNPK